MVCKMAQIYADFFQMPIKLEPVDRFSKFKKVGTNLCLFTRHSSSYIYIGNRMACNMAQIYADFFQMLIKFELVD